MSIAVSPDFSTSGHIYFDFSNNAGGQIHVDEPTVSEGSAPLSSLRALLSIEHSDANNHNGGQLQFGPDGMLYVSTGDGGGGDDQFHHSQDPESPLGKLLRLDPNGAIPANPASAIWSLGLRNPFRFSFDSLTGDMVIGDVGQSEREEVDFAPRLPSGGVGGQGANYGWNCREGFIEGPATDLPGEECATDFGAGTFTQPVFDFPTPTPATAVPTAARSSAATSSATRASATSTAATSASANCARWPYRPAPRAEPAMTAPRA